jgi:hypothetical protein
MKVEVNPGPTDAHTILDVPSFNFDDQKYEQLGTPFVLKAGDNLRVTCTHDAGLRKLLPQLKKLPLRYVVWGDGTSDEMCTGILVATPATCKATSLVPHALPRRNNATGRCATTDTDLGTPAATRLPRRHIPLCRPLQNPRLLQDFRSR